MLHENSNSMIEGLDDYFRETLAIDLGLVPWLEADGLPYYLRQGYVFYVGTVLEHQCLFVIHLGDHGGLPEGLSKQLARVRDKWGGLLLFVTHALSARQRRRLITQGVPFVVPDNQLFLPPLGIDLREHFIRQQKPPRQLDPSAQVLVLSGALRRIQETTLAQAAEDCGYSKMTMSRAFDAVEQLGLGIRGKRKRERVLQFTNTGLDLWNAAEPYLRDPVLRRLTILDVPSDAPMILAGESALARLTSLAAPRRRVLAIGPTEWAAICGDELITQVEAPHSNDVDIEVWRYHPQKLATDEVVDCLSLLLSMRSSTDPRIQIAVDDLKEQLPW
ncbi:MAG: hypothetical protein ACI9K5_003952 [Gammaproteobacteria bacterium]|jgi:hypothetical protein